MTSPPDRMLTAVRTVDVVACVALFGAALLCRLPMVPHFNVSSDSMDPLFHAWQMLSGTSSPFSAFNPLYGYGRAWSHIPLLLGADGLLDVVRAWAVTASFVPVFVYIAGRILVGGTGRAAGGGVGRRVGALLGPLVGAALLARYPGFVREQIFPHMYRSPELGAALMIPFAVLIRSLGLGGPDRDESSLPSRRTIYIAAAALGFLLAFMGLNHPYGAAAGGALVPLFALLLIRDRRAFLGPLSVFLGVAALAALPHVIYLALEAGQMGDGLVGYVRADTEFGAMDWSTTFGRLTTERWESRLGSLLARAPLLALVVGAIAAFWRPRLGGATALVAVSSVCALASAALLSKVAQHIQPYHWRPLLPLFALAAGLTVATVLDIGFRRNRAERARDLEQRRKPVIVVAKRLPAAFFGLYLVVLGLQAVAGGFQADEGYLAGLWSEGVVRQGIHHEAVGRRILAEKERTGTLSAFAGFDFPPFSEIIDQGAVTLDLLLGGVSSDELRTAWSGGPTEKVLLHVGLGERASEEVLDGLGPDIEVVAGGDTFLLLSGTSSSLRLWSRGFCPPELGPTWLVRPESPDQYRPHGYLEVRDLVRTEQRFQKSYLWMHPCLEPFAWPDFVRAEYPFSPSEHPRFELVPKDSWIWLEVGPGHLARTETPRRAWDACVKAGSCAPQEWPSPEDPWLPVTGVTAEQAAGFCRWAVDGREREGLIWFGDLPTELEWEQGAVWHQGVSEDRLAWPWGDEPTLEIANIASPDGGPDPVGSWPGTASPLDLEDMVGNVAEWVRKGERTAEGEGTQGVQEGYLLAGGSWRTPGSVILNAMFETPTTERPLDDVGFRCVIRGEEPQ